MKKILVSDYDDTFYLNDNDINNNVRLLNKNKDKIIFVIATGRSYYHFMPVNNIYNIPYDYLILDHGAIIIKDNEIIYKQNIDDNIIKELWNDAELENTIYHFACSGLDFDVSINANDLTKMQVCYESEEKCMEIYKKLKAKYQDKINCYFVSNKRAIEIVSKKASKKNAIDFLIERENYKNHEIYSVGDSDTDLEMLKAFNGYAMKNSSNNVCKSSLPTVESVSEIINLIVK